MRNTAEVWQVNRRLIAVYLKCSADNLLVAFYDIHGRKGDVQLFFLLAPDTTRDTL
jgi:hypothetical protein